MGVAAATVERTVVPLPLEPADKTALTATETAQWLELVRRLATPYFAREFCQPITTLHPELAVEYRKVIRYPMDFGTITHKLREGRWV